MELIDNLIASAKTRAFNQSVKRNIVSLKKSEDLFDDLLSEEDVLAGETHALMDIEAELKSTICPPDSLSRSFHYTAAIGYPFETDHYMATRYSDGSFPAWYGSLDTETTIYETLHWMIKECDALPDWSGGKLYRERAIYDVSVDTIPVDLCGLTDAFPDLIADNYDFTQQVGKAMTRSRMPALLYASARDPRPSQANIAVFEKAVLSNPKLLSYLCYEIDYASRQAFVTDGSNRQLLSVTL